jgi:glycosyltransferase involved in cell wall biosynthesis
MKTNSELFRKLQSRSRQAEHKPVVRPQVITPQQTPQSKKKLLYWADSPTTTTGFGVVSKYLLWGIHLLGRYDIDCLAINYYGEFFDKKQFPYQIISSRLRDPRDYYGNEMFISAIEHNDYDTIIVMNDMFVVEQVAEKYRQVIQAKQTAGKKIPKLIYYYPVDCRVVPGTTKFAALADAAVAYSDFAVAEMIKADPNLPTQRIYLGSNPEVFTPLSADERRRCRAQYLGIQSDNTFVIINVNRNSLRKDIAKSIKVFSEFQKQYADTILYCHTAVIDSGAGSMHPIDLGAALAHLGHATQTRVRFPANFQVANGFPERSLNELYNCADCYLSTHNGEGFGLTQIEAMAAGVPVVVPDNTVTPELIGLDGDRGYVYPCQEEIFIDASGYRKTGRIEDVLAKVVQCGLERGTSQQVDMLRRARKFAIDLSWRNIWLQWTMLLESVEAKPSKLANSGVSEAL